MSLSDGQVRALDQLRRIECTPDSAIRIDHIEEPATDNGRLIVDLSINCKSYEFVDGGLKLNPRESIQIYIPHRFPYQPPSVWVSHVRFDGFDHVQWKRHLCLYQAPDTEWHPETGMYGFMRRVHAWLQDASLNQLDADGAALHPPAVYPASNTIVCTNSDTPTFEDSNWIGGAILNRITNDRLDLNGWVSYSDTVSLKEAVPAILLSTPFSFEYPTNVRSLIRQLESAGVSTPSLILLLAGIARARGHESPLHVVVGTPMRGTAGINGERKQHLAVWEIEPIAVHQLSLIEQALDLCARWGDREGKEDLNELTDEIIKNFYKWMDESKVGWCRVLENRPEVTIRRDLDTPMSTFRHKRVAIWGCGALGGHIAEHLVRAKVDHITLIDNSNVNPGVLVRQNFEQTDIGTPKAEAVAKRLKRISSTVNCTPINADIHRAVLDQPDWTDQFDVVIDATASLQVRTRLEEVSRRQNKKTILAAMMVSGQAEYGALAIVGPNYSGATLDVFRRLGLATMNREHLVPYRDAFWPKETGLNIFQPEPGCSDPTFIGSSADVASLSARMLNKLGTYLRDGANDTGEGCLLANNTIGLRDYRFTFKPDIIISTENDLDVRIDRNAWRDITGWINEGARKRGADAETGGLLFGQLNEASRTLWVTEVIGPPKDSQFSADEFVCGTEGTAQFNEEKQNRTRGSVQFIGTWHSHPTSPAVPSIKDWGGIGRIFAANLTQAPTQLMVIVGHAGTSPEIGAYIFERSALQNANQATAFSVSVSGGVVAESNIPSYGKRIGLALSGGGSRAIAYHLGCLRALDDLNLLDDVEVISGVSGGSVMTALLGYDHGSFSDIDKKTVEFLKAGLVRPSLKKLILKLRILPIIGTFAVSTLPVIVIGLVRNISTFALSLFNIGEKITPWVTSLRWPLRRWFSRTHVIAEALSDVLGNERLDTRTRGGKAIIFNACELATGTAFRMSNTTIGSWRFGKMKPNALRIADAVAASAAFPPALPAFDWKMEFEDPKTGDRKMKRVVITDGGVYENLAVSCLEPRRSTEFSINTYSPEIIISCDAGAGQLKGDAATGIWPSRMAQAFEAVFRKVQDATKGRLHSYAEQGQLEAFVYSNLGQIDERIPARPSVWISREEVMDYPTNFSAMKEDDIAKLTTRGEYVTRTLISRYLLCD